ncbi:MAG TPA: hypothetical protein VHT51_01870 [Micropepsaceae bacterium]|nr:hypothetical protein [Micropepsaceae bacterium]
MPQRVGRWKKKRSRKHEIWISVIGVLFFASLGILEIVVASDRAKIDRPLPIKGTNTVAPAARPR